VSARDEYVTGLRMLADLLDNNPNIPLPYTGREKHTGLLWILHDDQRATLAAIAKALPGKVEKSVRVKDGAFDLIGQLAGFHVKAIANRDEVCTRVVVGTETITKKVPDPSVTVPEVEVTETVERIDWICTPLLADGEATS